MLVNECNHIERNNEKNQFTKFQTVKRVMKEFCNKSTFFVFQKKIIRFYYIFVLIENKQKKKILITIY